jgi:hypothetical protein
MDTEVRVNPDALRGMAQTLDRLEAALQAIRRSASSCIDAGMSDDPAESELVMVHDMFTVALLAEFANASDQIGKYAENMRVNADNYEAADVLEAPQ